MGTTGTGPAEPYWRGHVEAWRVSGGSRSDYCAKHSLSRKAFGWWVWHFERAERQGDDAPRFLPVDVAEVAVAAPELGDVATVMVDERIEIALPDGLRVRVGTGFDAAALRRVLVALGR